VVGGGAEALGRRRELRGGGRRRATTERRSLLPRTRVPLRWRVWRRTQRNAAARCGGGATCRLMRLGTSCGRPSARGRAALSGHDLRQIGISVGLSMSRMKDVSTTLLFHFSVCVFSRRKRCPWAFFLCDAHMLAGFSPGGLSSNSPQKAQVSEHPRHSTIRPCACPQDRSYAPSSPPVLPPSLAIL